MLKRYTILGAIFVLITGTLNHFLYDWLGQNPIIGLFTPVNESTWEHMKLIFFPMLIYSSFLYQECKKSYPDIDGALLTGILTGTVLIPIIFYTYTGILGKNIPVLDISTFILSVILAFIIIFQLASKKQPIPCTNLLFVFLCTFLICFGIFTYNPPDIGLFAQPM